jgi:endonuclease YncB( thermonuclease family)
METVLKKLFTCSLLFAAMFLLGFGNDVRAASLYGKVIEVNEGDLITVFNLNRPVKVRLLGVDAPDIGQPFAEVAQQHLKDLVLDRMVLVEYTGLSANSSIVGKVTVDGADICAQMIRDGAAWFDINNNSRLSEVDRQVYGQSEAAARTERRGIWQSNSATAPWEFKKLEARRALDNSTRTGAPKRPLSPTRKLSPEAILGSDYVTAGDASNASNMAWASPIAREWRQFEPPGQNFSVFVPQGGRKSVETTLFREQPIHTYAYMVREVSNMYAVVWLAGPHLGETDEVAIPIMIAGVLKGFSMSYEKAGLDFHCDVKTPRVVPVKGYVAREFDIIGCHSPGVVRVYTRVVGEERQFVIGLSFFEAMNSNVSRFLKSFQFRSE